jgi:hypothetical protein
MTTSSVKRLRLDADNNYSVVNDRSCDNDIDNGRGNGGDNGMNSSFDGNIGSWGDASGSAPHAKVIRSTSIATLHNQLQNLCHIDPMVKELMKHVVPFETTTTIGRPNCMLLLYPPTKCLVTKNTLDNKTGDYLKIFNFMTENTSVVETFPFAHNSSTKLMNQKLLASVLQGNSVFHHTIIQYLRVCIELEYQVYSKNYPFNKHMIIYLGGKTAVDIFKECYPNCNPLADSPIQGLLVTSNGIVGYPAVHPSYHMVSDNTLEAINLVNQDLTTYKSLQKWSRGEDFTTVYNTLMLDCVRKMDNNVKFLEENNINRTTLEKFQKTSIFITNVTALKFAMTMYQKTKVFTTFLHLACNEKFISMNDDRRKVVSNYVDKIISLNLPKKIFTGNKFWIKLEKIHDVAQCLKEINVLLHMGLSPKAFANTSLWTKLGSSDHTDFTTLCCQINTLLGKKLPTKIFNSCGLWSKLKSTRVEDFERLSIQIDTLLKKKLPLQVFSCNSLWSRLGLPNQIHFEQLCEHVDILIAKNISTKVFNFNGFWANTKQRNYRDFERLCEFIETLLTIGITKQALNQSGFWVSINKTKNFKRLCNHITILLNKGVPNETFTINGPWSFLRSCNDAQFEKLCTRVDIILGNNIKKQVFRNHSFWSKIKSDVN